MNTKHVFLKLCMVALMMPAFLFYKPTPAQADGATCTMVGSNWTETWDDPTHWDCGKVPGYNDSVIIPWGWSARLTTYIQINDLDLLGTIYYDAIQTSDRAYFFINRNFSWGGTIRGNGLLALTVETSASSHTVIGDNAVLNNANFVNWGVIDDGTGNSGLNSNGDIDNNGPVTVHSGGISGTGTFHNQTNGVLNIAYADVASSKDITNRVYNTGTINILSGALRLESNTDQTEAGTINMADGTGIFIGASVTFDTTLNATGAQKDIFLEVDWQTATLNQPVTVKNAIINQGVLKANAALKANNFTIAGHGMLDGTGTVEVTDELDWSWGVIGWANSTLTVNLDPSCMTVLDSTSDNVLYDVPLYNAGTLTMNKANGLNLSSKAVINNAGTMNMNKADVNQQGGKAVNNLAGGVVNINANTTFSTQFNNDGTVNVHTGVLNLRSWSGASTGAFNLDAGTTLNPSFGDYHFNKGASITGLGSLQVDNYETWMQDASVSVTDLVQTAPKLHAGDMTLKGDFIHTSGAFDDPAGKIQFAGHKEQHINLSAPTTIYDLEVSSGTTLVEDGDANNATLTGELINNGTIQKRKEINAAGRKEFGLTGAELNITDKGALTGMKVELVGSLYQVNNQAMPGPNWVFTPTGTGYTTDLTLPHVIVPADAQICQSTASGWNCAVSSVTATGVTLTGLTELGTFAILDVNQNVDLNLALQADQTKAKPNAPFTYTLAITNTGLAGATGVKLIDTLPAGVTINNATSSQGSCDVTSGKVTCQLGEVGIPVGAASSTFDGSAEGWTGDAHVVTFTWIPSGGHPGGFIQGNGSATWYFTAPASFTGNHADSYNQALTFYIKRTGAPFLHDQPDVILKGGGLTLNYSFPSNDSPASTWTFYRIHLNESAGWTNQASGQPATRTEIKAVLANMTALSIRGSNANADNVSAALDGVVLQHPATPISISIQVTPQVFGALNNSAVVSANEEDANPADNTAQNQVIVFGVFYLPYITK